MKKFYGKKCWWDILVITFLLIFTLKDHSLGFYVLDWVTINIDLSCSGIGLRKHYGKNKKTIETVSSVELLLFASWYHG